MAQSDRDDFYLCGGVVMIIPMFRFFSFAACVFLLPLCVLAYTSVIAKPELASTVLTIDEVEKPQEVFGTLTNYPHTFDFSLSEKLDFKASVFVHEKEGQKNDVSIILVKKERRGVSEVGRTSIKDSSWESQFDPILVERFREGGVIAASLEAGEYTLEVSAPNNDGAYRLRIGEGVHRGYFDNLRALFEIKELYGSSPFSVILSPLLYVPILILLMILGIFFYFRLRRP
jgi:hypothetical protein